MILYFWKYTNIDSLYILYGGPFIQYMAGTGGHMRFNSFENILKLSLFVKYMADN